MRRLVVCVLGTVLLSFTPGNVPAAMYQCIDGSGARSFTDSPIDARQCARADGSASPSTSEKPTVPPPRGPRPEPAGSDPAQAEQRDGSLAPKDAGGYVSVPLQPVGRSLAITVRLNGERQARLILDTGATLTLLSRTIARDLGLYGESPVSSALVNTAGGQVTVDVMKIGAIEVGGATVHNVPVAIFDLPDAPPSIEGLLGLSFLSHFLVTLDIKQNELRLTSR